MTGGLEYFGSEPSSWQCYGWYWALRSYGDDVEDGYRRITALLRLDGWWVNHKRVERIWRREGLTVLKKQTKRGHLWFNEGTCVRLRAEGPNHVWAYDFVQVRTHEGRSFRMLTLVDEYTRECLAIDVARQLNSEDVLERLAWLMVTRGVPDHIRSDNGPEFTAKAVRQWLRRDLAPWNKSMSNVSEVGMDAFRKGQGSWPRNGTAPSRSSQN